MKPDRWPENTLTPNSIVFEVGAYRGDWMRGVSYTYNPRIYAFEPSQYTFKALRSIPWGPKISLFKFGLSDKSYSCLLYDCEKDGATVMEKRKGNTPETVHIIDICKFVAWHSLSRIDLIHINIEGAEYDLIDRILDTDLNGMINYLMVQWHAFSPEMGNRCTETVARLKETRRKVLHPSNAAWGIWVPK